MPPRKSNASVISNGLDEGTDATPAKTSKEASKDAVSVEDLTLPKSMIARLAKGVLPANTQIQKDALLAFHKSATVFVSYIASNANENAHSGGKKTIAPQDVMAALKDCEFEPFLPRLEAELKKYNEVQCDKRNTYRRKVKEGKAAAAARDGDDVSKDGERPESANGMSNGHDDVDDGDRPSKKFKTEDGSAIVPDGMDEDDMPDDLDGEEDEDNDDDGDDGDDGDDEDDEDDSRSGFVHVNAPDPDELPDSNHMQLERSDSDVDDESDSD